MSINEIMEKIKSFLAGEESQGVFIIIIIVLVAFGSFGLGRLSKTGGAKEALRIDYSSQEAKAVGSSLPFKKDQGTSYVSVNTEKSTGQTNDKMFVASKKGKKY